MMNDTDRDRLPLPSEDAGDLVHEPRDGMTDDPLVASEEGVPYDPPSDRVLSETRLDQGGPDVAGTASGQAQELERTDMIQPPGQESGEIGGRPADSTLQADVLEALRASDLTAGTRIGVHVVGGTVYLRGSVESQEIADEIEGLVGEVPGVDEVVDELEIG
jgi:BON domain-containing protein